MNSPPHMHGQPRPDSGGGGAGIVIGILVAVLLVIPMFAVLGIYGVRKFLANAKTAEQKNMLGQIAHSAVDVYERDGRICPSASMPIPQSTASIRGRKYQSAQTDWTVDAPAKAGFACLGVELNMPQYYQYDYKATATGFTAYARGDLDGDGKLSEFSLEGRIVNGKLELSPISDTNPDE